MPLSSTLKKTQFSSSSQGESNPQQSRNTVKYALKIMPANHDKIKSAKSATALKTKTKDPRPKTQSRNREILFSRKPHNPRRIAHFLLSQNQKDRENALFNLWKNPPPPRKPYQSINAKPRRTAKAVQEHGILENRNRRPIVQFRKFDDQNPINLKAAFSPRLPRICRKQNLPTKNQSVDL